MKVSTMHPHHAYGRGVIILYCGPHTDENKCKEIGITILKETEYTNLSKKMFYKTDTQTLAKGKQGYHKWELPIPNENFEKKKLNKTNHDNDDEKTASISKPAPTAPKPRAPMPTAPMPTAPIPTAPIPTAPIPTAPIPTAPIPTGAPIPSTTFIPMAPIPMGAPIPPGPIRTGAPIPIPMAAPIPGTGSGPKAPPMPKKKKMNRYMKYLTRMKTMGFQRVVVIKKDNFEMLASLNQRLDSKEKWKLRIEQQ
eukprot:122021_1